MPQAYACAAGLSSPLAGRKLAVEVRAAAPKGKPRPKAKGKPYQRTT